MEVGHLVLSRKVGQSIICTLEDGREVRIVLLDVQGRRARLGFESDRHVSVRRAELVEIPERESA